MTARTRCVQFRECGELLYGGIEVFRTFSLKEM